MHHRAPAASTSASKARSSWCVTSYTVSCYVGSFWLASLASSLGVDEAVIVNLAPWLGVLAAGLVGALLGVMHAVICNLPRVNFVAVGIAMMVFGVGLAAYLGKPMIQPVAPKLQAFDFGWWAESEQVRFALRVNALFLVGLVLTPILAWMLISTRWGMILTARWKAKRRGHGLLVNTIRIFATRWGASSRESAAASCRFTIPAPGTNRSHRARV